MRILVLVLVLLLPASLADAQSNTYSKWQNPDASSPASNEKLQTFIAKLKALVAKAEKAQAASPQFLRDLKDLASGFERPWRNLVLNDTFADGNFTANPTWQVSAGEYWIEQNWGLRTSVDPAAANAQPQQKTLRGKDAAAAIFGQILNQAMGGKQQAEATPPPVPTEAVIHTNTAVSNAFSVAFNMYTQATKGRIEIAAFQGQFAGPARSPGYRLIYQPEGRLELLRISSRGVSIIDGTNELPSLKDKKFHQVVWLRYPDGRMEISIDGTTLLKTTDRGFSDPFSGLAIINRGGDFIFKQVRIDGT
jgi:hypothetical protein